MRPWGAEAKHRGCCLPAGESGPSAPFADEQAGTQRLTAGASLGACDGLGDPPAVQETGSVSPVRNIPLLLSN